jgi:predicted DNA-binding transcriptional regulator AlpA
VKQPLSTIATATSAAVQPQSAPTQNCQRSATMSEVPPLRLLLDAKESAVALRIGERAFHALRRHPGFPRPITLGARTVRWRLDDLHAWARSQKANDTAPEPPQLAAGRARRKSSSIDGAPARAPDRSPTAHAGNNNGPSAASLR